MNISERIQRSRLVSNRHRRFFECMNVYGILNPNAIVRTDLLALRILKLLVVLYSKVLPFNLFFDLLSLVVASS